MDEDEWVPPDWVQEMNRKGGKLPDMELLRFLFDLTPPGDAFAAAQGARDVARGETRAGILGLLGAVPIGGDLFKALRARRRAARAAAARADDVPLPRLDPEQQARDIRQAQRIGFNNEMEQRSWQRLLDEMGVSSPEPRARPPMLPAPDARDLKPEDIPGWLMDQSAGPRRGPSGLSLSGGPWSAGPGARPPEAPMEDVLANLRLRFLLDDDRR